MKKTRKLISMFAIMLIVVLSVGCFATACGKNKHDYSVLKSDATGHWYECSDGDGETDGFEEHKYDSGKVTTEATCTAEGVTTYTCEVCGYTRTEPIAMTAHTIEAVKASDPTCTEAGTIEHYTCTVCGKSFSDEAGTTEIADITDPDAPATGHSFVNVTESDVTWKWDETAYTATATAKCDACGDDVVFTATVTSNESDDSIVYTATVEIGGKTYTDEKVVTTGQGEGKEKETLPYTLEVDFSDSSTYSWIATETVTDGDDSYEQVPNGGVYSTENGILTLYASAKSDSYTTIGKEAAGALNTSGATSGSDGRYFKIELSGYEDCYVTIEVLMASNSDYDSSKPTETKYIRSLFVSAKAETPNKDDSAKSGLAYVTSEGKTDYKTLSYSQKIENEQPLYLTSDASVNIYSIKIKISEDEPSTNPDVSAEPSYSVVITGAENNVVSLGITDGQEGDVYGSATLTATLYDGETLVGDAVAVWALAENANEGVVTFDQNGNVTAAKEGETALTVTFYGVPGKRTF